jgi:endogenous inhibitor of DNA gyrase (YacG/DUF329 family)
MARTGRPTVKMIQVTCTGCGVEMERYPSVVKNNRSGRFFCSIECRDLIGSKPRRKADATCEACGTVFYPINAGPNRFCSVACHNIGQTKTPVDLSCEHCGKAFQVKPSASERRFCSKECEGRSRWKRVQGRTHNGKPVLHNPQGYVKIWEPSLDPRRSWVLEHRYVVEQAIGRKLRADEHVHHVNGDRADNRLENLEVIDPTSHQSITMAAALERRARERAELERYRALFGPLPED